MIKGLGDFLQKSKSVHKSCFHIIFRHIPLRRKAKSLPVFDFCRTAELHKQNLLPHSITDKVGHFKTVISKNLCAIGGKSQVIFHLLRARCGSEQDICGLKPLIKEFSTAFFVVYSCFFFWQFKAFGYNAAARNANTFFLLSEC